VSRGGMWGVPGCMCVCPSEGGREGRLALLLHGNVGSGDP
jgi:hypothetical protein